MRKTLLVILSAILIIITNVHAQTQFQHSYLVLADSSDNNSKMLKGAISKNDIANDTAFKWYAESRKIYDYPDSAAVAAFSKNKDKISFVIFMGTWCDDTQFIIPKFFKIQEASDFPLNRIIMFAMDRKKTTLDNIETAFNATRTPTIIVMENGKEKGRVVEYGKTGYWDKELAEIINN